MFQASLYCGIGPDKELTAAREFNTEPEAKQWCDLMYSLRHFEKYDRSLYEFRVEKTTG